MMRINITAIVESKTETLLDTLSLLKEMAVNSKKEESCIQYDLHQDKENPTLFVFHEIWESEEGLALHETQPYFQKFVVTAPELLVHPVTVFKTNLIV